MAENNKDNAPIDTGSVGTGNALQNQVRLLKTIVAILLAAFLVAGGLLYYTRRAVRPIAVLLDGKPVATLHNLGSAIATVVAAEHSIVGSAYPTENIIRLQKLQYQRLAGDAPVDSEDTARRALAAHLKLRIRAYVIKVDGHPSVGLPTAQEAAEALERVKKHYEGMPPLAPILVAGAIKQKTSIELMPVAPDRARANAAEAAEYFWTPPPSKTYIVKQGDRGFTIAVHNRIAFADFLMANAGRDMNKLRIGDVVNIQKMPPTLTVEVKKRVERNEPMIPNSDPGEGGLRHVIYVATYTNGVETNRDIVTWQVITKPHPRMNL